MTREETAWCDRVQQLGCIACYVENVGDTPCEIHHLKTGGRRIDHLHSIGLCYPHHRSHRNDSAVTSVHPWTRAFEARYGKQAELWELTKKLLEAA